MTLTSNGKRLWTRVSPDGKSMAGAMGMKPGGGGDPQPYDGHGQYLGTHAAVSLRTGAVRVAAGTLLADSGRIATDAGGWSNEVRRLEEKQYTPERLVQNAKADLGSDRWAPKVVDGETKNQCNVFVASKLRESGAHVPNVGGWSGSLGEGPSDYLNEKTDGSMGGHIPSASDWHKGVPGWEKVKTEDGKMPMPGDVASNGKHVGIVSGEGKTTSVTTADENSPDYGRVVENDWGFRHKNKGKMAFWRYKGVPAPR